MPAPSVDPALPVDKRRRLEQSYRAGVSVTDASRLVNCRPDLVREAYQQFAKRGLPRLTRKRAYGYAASHVTPPYLGPVWIGVPLGAPPQPDDSGNWIGKAITDEQGNPVASQASGA
jgi:hypothetical protein